ncbi:MAG: hypothetical protein LBU98_04410 [Alistipes sp.]|nr:hypothetical protein [Alistipes sp.]
MKKHLNTVFAAALAACALTFASCSPGDDAPEEFTISVTASAGGAASAGVARAAAGTSVTVSAVAADGYRFDKWTVEKGGVSLSGNPATFTMPAAAVAVRADFAAVSAPPVTAEDLVGSIAGTKTLDAAITYTITGPVLVEEGGVLDIPAGTRIEANKGFGSYILVLQGGMINVRGTAAAPVVMTSNEASPAAGDWGGLVINGKAPLAGPAGTTARTEISNAYIYGGTDAADNSGTISYLVIEHSGARSSANIEHNGLTLNGVGSGTTISNIFIDEGADDGIEFFGGSVDVDGLLAVNCDDDMFDFTQGYNGTLSNAYGVWEAGFSSTEADPRGVEADGNFDGNNPEYGNQSDFTITDVTFDLRVPYSAEHLWTGSAKTMQDLVKIRRNAQATVTNALVKGVAHVQDMIDISDGSELAPFSSTINITNQLVAPEGATNPDGTVKPAEYSGVTIAAGNTGCETSVFGWTGYTF